MAPSTPGGHHFIPQHYLRYQHTAESIQQIISEIDYADNVLLFAAADITGMYCLLYTSPSPRDRTRSRMPSSA